MNNDSWIENKELKWTLDIKDDSSVETVFKNKDESVYVKVDGQWVKDG